MTTNRLDQIEARAKAATDGPWERNRTYLGGAYLVSVRSPHVTVAEGFLKRDAEFIAHARADVPDLVAFVRDVEARHAARSNGARNGWLGEPFTDCAGCGKPWPCPDRQALDRLNGATSDG